MKPIRYTRAVIDGRDSWVFPDGKVLPVVSGGDHSATLERPNITSPELTEVEGKLKERRKTLHDIFEEAGPERDMGKVKSIDGDSNAKVEQIQAINTEINDLSIEAKKLTTLLVAAGHAFDYDDPSVEQGAPGGPTRQKSLGQQFAAGIGKRDTKRFSEEFPDVDVKATMTTAAGWAPDIIRGPRMVPFATRPLELMDLIPQTTTTQAAVSYMEETTMTNAAAERDEGAAKAESTLVLTERTSTVRSIATSLPVTDEQIEDVDRIAAYIDNRLGFFLRQRLELQELVGNGTAPNLRGVNNVVGVQTQAKGADPTPDAIYKAMVLVMTVGQATPDGVVMNPLDWQDVRLLRTADGLYIWGNPSEAGPERIWGLPVVLSQAQTQNTAVVGAWQIFSELAVKKGVTIERGFINDDFTKDITRLRAEMRAALIFYRPTAFCLVTGV